MTTVSAVDEHAGPPARDPGASATGAGSRRQRTGPETRRPGLGRAPLAGLALGGSGLLGKELRSRSRGWRPAWLLTGYLLVLAAAVTGFLTLISRTSGTIPPTLGTWLYASLALGSVLLLALITPALTAGAISGERERKTLDLLLVTRASPLGIVLGKLLGSLATVLFLLVASLPAFTLVYLFGGVPPLYVGMVLAVAAVTAVSCAALGLFLSAVLKRTLLASVLAYMLVFAVVLVIPFVSWISTAVQGTPFQVMASSRYMPSPNAANQSTVPPLYVTISPLISALSVLPMGLMGGQQLTTGPIWQSTYVVGRDPVTGTPELTTTWAPWVYHFAFSAVVTAVCLLGAALAVSPIKPWQRLRRWRRRP